MYRNDGKRIIVDSSDEGFFYGGIHLNGTTYPEEVNISPMIWLYDDDYRNDKHRARELKAVHEANVKLIEIMMGQYVRKSSQTT
jgi:hypothetical protein